MSLIDLIWREIMTPSDQTGPADAAYRAGMSALGHAMLGAAFASTFGLWGLAPALAIAATYWWVKERSDLRRGGAWLDSAEDALMVCLGVWYGPAWWPAAMLACCAVVMLSRAVRL